MQNKIEKVIFRREYDPYMKMWKYLCIFPEDKQRNGNIGCVSSWLNDDGKWWHDNYDSGSPAYFHKCKIIHKDEPVVNELVRQLKMFYGGEYKVVEKMC